MSLQSEHCVGLEGRQLSCYKFEMSKIVQRWLLFERHVSEVFDLSRPETNAYNELLRTAKRDIEQRDPEVAGFNIGINNGEVAGQTVQHCHLHLVPRRVGDVENPVGGIRNVIPGKGSY